MRILSDLTVSTLGIVLLLSPPVSFAVSGDVVGTWTGESKCTVPDSPCHDEQVVLRIAADPKNKRKKTINADKIVNGRREFMGTLACDYYADKSKLSCTANTPKGDDWEFQVSGNSMSGTLTMGEEKTLFRRIAVHRTSGKEE